MATIKIEGIGQVEIPDNQAWATEETQKKIEFLLLQNSKKSTKQKFKNEFGGKNEPGTFGYGLDQSAKSFEELVDETKEYREEVKSNTRGLLAFGKNVLGSGQSFSTLNPVIEKTSSVLSDLAGGIPIVGGVLGAAIGALSEVRQTLNEVLDSQIVNFDSFARAGMSASRSLIDLQASALENRISLDTLVAVTTSASEGIIALGGNFDAGVQKFLQTQAYLQQMDGNMLEKLGFTVDQQAAFLGEFIENNRNNLLLQKMDQYQLNAAVGETAKNMRILAEFTGVDVETQRQIAMRNAANMAFQARLSELPVEQADNIREFVNQLGTIDPSGILAQAFIEQFSQFGGPVTTQSGILVGQLSRAGVSLDDFAARVEEGADPKTVLADFISQSSSLITDGQTTFLAQLGLVEGATGEVAQVAQGIFESLSRFSGKDIEEELKNAIENVEKVDENIDGFNNILIESRQELQESLGQLSSAILQGAEGILAWEAENIGQMGEALKQILKKDATAVEITTGLVNLITESAIGVGTEDVGGWLSRFTNWIWPKEFSGQIPRMQFGGNLFPGMTALVGEAGPELLSIGNSFGEVMSNKDTQNLFGDMKGMMDSLAGGLQSGDISGTMSKMQEMAPSFESSLQKIGGQVESQVGGSQSLANLEATMSRANTDFQKQSVDYAAQNQVTLEKIEKLLSRILPKALSGNGYF